MSPEQILAAALTAAAAGIHPRPGLAEIRRRTALDVHMGPLIEQGLLTDTSKLTPPNGCRHCGLPERGHFQRWTRDAGWHGWTAPTDAQRLERMRARRNQNLKKTAPAATTAEADPALPNG